MNEQADFELAIIEIVLKYQAGRSLDTMRDWIENAFMDLEENEMDAKHDQQ